MPVIAGATSARLRQEVVARPGLSYDAPMPKKRRRSPSGTAKTRRSKPTADQTPESTPTSGRYTAPTSDFRLRPRWHRWVGWLGVALGILVIVANDAMFFAETPTLLPGGHNELYLMLGLAVAGAFTWFLGLFDRGTTIFD